MKKDAVLEQLSSKETGSTVTEEEGEDEDEKVFKHRINRQAEIY